MTTELCSTGFQANGAPPNTFIFGTDNIEERMSIVDTGLDAVTAEAFGCTGATANYDVVQVLHYVPGKSSRTDFDWFVDNADSLFGVGTTPVCLQPAPPSVCSLYAKTHYSDECEQGLITWTDDDAITTGIFDYDVETGWNSGRINPAGIIEACADFVSSYEQFCFCPNGELAPYVGDIEVDCGFHRDRIAADMGCQYCTAERARRGREVLMGDLPCCPGS